MRLPAGLEAYRDRRILITLALGFSSGLPLALSGATLSFWLSTVGISKTQIGLFALVGLAYNFKFVWAPVFDHLRAPVLATLGRRRAWGIVTQLGLVAALLFTGSTDPAVDPLMTALGAVLVAFFSASQDIVIDAYRVELLDERQQGAGAAVTQYGYRLGMLAAGAGALFLSTVLPWSGVYAVMAGLVMVGAAVFLVSPEPSVQSAPRPSLEEAVWAPFRDFGRRQGWVSILLFVLLFKLGDALAGVMANPFYVETGFTAEEVAAVSKVFGLIATLLGIGLGGALVGWIGIERALLVAGVLQLMSNWMFAWQAIVGHDVGWLAVTIFIENGSGGLGSAAFVAFLSQLCSRRYTATQYALLSSLAAAGRTFLSAGGGWLAERLDWPTFFFATSLAAVPGLLLLLWLMRRRPEPSGAGASTAAE